MRVGNEFQKEKVETPKKNYEAGGDDMTIICPDCKCESVVRLKLDRQEPPIYGAWCQDCGRMWTVYSTHYPERVSTGR